MILKRPRPTITSNMGTWNSRSKPKMCWWNKSTAWSTKGDMVRCHATIKCLSNSPLFSILVVVTIWKIYILSKCYDFSTFLFHLVFHKIQCILYDTRIRVTPGNFHFFGFFRKIFFPSSSKAYLKYVEEEKKIIHKGGKIQLLVIKNNWSRSCVNYVQSETFCNLQSPLWMVLKLTRH